MAEESAEDNCRQLGGWTTKVEGLRGSKEARWHGSCRTPEGVQIKTVGVRSSSSSSSSS